MKPFLLELAEDLHTRYGNRLETLTLVFPNRRAILYFRKHLSSLLTKPAFSPALLTIEDFIAGFSTTLVPDKLELIHRLYNVYHSVLHGDRENDPVKAESFDQFYFWGEMLLRDFDEADKYLVRTEHLFKDLSNQKELDAGFDFLDPEQLEFLKSFWNSFQEKDSANKSRFLYIWRQLQQMYIAFRDSLRKEHLAYEGMLHREVADQIAGLYKRGNTKSHAIVAHPDGLPSLVFAGFNALTGAEEKIMSWFVAQNLATISWDVDAYYMHHSIQEAGKFFREYQQHPVLGKTFPPDIQSNFKKLKVIHLYGASQPIGQAKLMAQLLSDKLKSGYKAEETLIVLPDEKLVMPVLHGVSAEVDKLNVTMGFPLTSTPLFNLVELIVEMQINHKEECFNHQQVIAILGHPYVVAADAGEAQAKRKYIFRQNWVLVPVNYLRSTVALHRELFRPFVNNPLTGYTSNLIEYLRTLIIETGRLKNLQALDREFCFHFLKLLNQLERIILPGNAISVDQISVEGLDEKQARKVERLALKSFLRLFRQLIKLEKIPFRGEPLQGLQVMGVLETRNLDYKNVFILSLNEGSFPSFNSRGSYIPFNIRKAYGLPIPEHQDAIYAYLFYRVMQRAENVYLFHNTETDELGQGELSRYVQQLIFESGIPIERHILHNELHPLEITPITVVKDDSVYAGLARYCTGNFFQRSLSPSALNDYLECRLRFYFRYIARIKEADEIEEDLDARVLGNFVHKVMEFFYQHILDEKKTNRIERKDFDTYGEIDPLIDKVFIENYHLADKKVNYEGQRLVVKEVVRRFVRQIIDQDKKYAPFSIEALERRDIMHEIRIHADGNPVVVLGGSIDRADRKDNVIRVVDYKTGKDDLTFNDVASLFDRDAKRNKAAFQTLLYTFLYKKAEPHPGLKFVPGLLNRMNLFKGDFKFGLIHQGDYLTDATPLLPEFEASIVALLNEVYAPEIPFDQTPHLENCKFCSYQRICYR